MNRTAPVVLAALAALALAGCSTETPEENFVRVLHENREIQLTDAELLDLGDDVCAAIAMGGGSLIIGLGLSSGLTADDFGYVTGVATATLCPDED